MKKHENKTQKTAYSYANSINKISNHFSEKTGEKIDIYSLIDIEKIREISNDYSTLGKFSKYGYEGNRTIRSAIAAYLKFYTSLQTGKEISDTSISIIDGEESAEP